MYLMQIAYEEAIKSPDESSQNGAIIWKDNQVVSRFFNSPVKNTAAIQTRPEKYRVFEHAESGAILSGCSDDVSDAMMICPWAPCSNCARAIILAGINFLVVHKERMELTPEHWLEDIAFAHKMLAENDVDLLYFSGSVTGAPPILVNGKLWSPELLCYV